MRNLESNETSPSSLTQKLTELWDFKNGIWKTPFLMKRLFKTLVIFFIIWNCILHQIFVLKQCTFVPECNVLLSSSKCHIKVQPFFYQNQWKSKNRIFWPFFSKSSCVSFSKIHKVKLFFIPAHIYSAKTTLPIIFYFILFFFFVTLDTYKTTLAACSLYFFTSTLQVSQWIDISIAINSCLCKMNVRIKTAKRLQVYKEKKILKL